MLVRTNAHYAGDAGGLEGHGVRVLALCQCEARTQVRRGQLVELGLDGRVNRLLNSLPVIGNHNLLQQTTTQQHSDAE